MIGYFPASSLYAICFDVSRSELRVFLVRQVCQLVEHGSYYQISHPFLALHGELLLEKPSVIGSARLDPCEDGNQQYANHK